MRVLRRFPHLLAIALGVLFIGFCVGGMIGAWAINRWATNLALKGFGVIETGVEVISAGVTRADELITTARTEVRQTAETMTTVGGQAAANSPVLIALNERLESRLSPRIAQLQLALAPMREAVRAIGYAIGAVNALPMMEDRAPRLAALDESMQRLEELSADTAQLRGTIRAMVTAQDVEVTAEAIVTINGLTQRIDKRLGEVQANVHGVQSEVEALQARVDARKSRLLFAFNLGSMLATLMLTWIVYTQAVVTRHHRAKIRGVTSRPHQSSLDRG